MINSRDRLTSFYVNHGPTYEHTTVRRNSELLHFFNQIKGQQNSQIFKILMSLVEKNLEGRNFVALAYIT